MDMLPYQKFTSVHMGHDYGSSDDSTQFAYIYRYSPLHNLKRAWPTGTLATTADHDDRLCRAFIQVHRYLAGKAGRANPVLIRIETRSATAPATHRCALT